MGVSRVCHGGKPGSYVLQFGGKLPALYISFVEYYFPSSRRHTIRVRKVNEDSRPSFRVEIGFLLITAVCLGLHTLLRIF